MHETQRMAATLNIIAEALEGNDSNAFDALLATLGSIQPEVVHANWKTANALRLLARNLVAAAA